MTTDLQKNTTIKVAHSPDSDDAFMFHAITNKKIDLAGINFKFASDEIEVLNQQALLSTDTKAEHDIFAISFHAYPYLQDKFQILKAGASMGAKSYGPRLVCRPKLFDKLNKNNYTQQKLSLGHALKDKNISYRLRIAIPGKLTSANLCLKLFAAINNIEYDEVFCKFNEVFDYLQEDKADVALLIHESQISFEEYDCKLILDLGAWWYQLTGGLKMPLGTNVVRRDLPLEIKKNLASILSRSIGYGLDNFDETLEYAREFSNNGLNDDKAKQYINMYVNESTRELSVQDIKSIEFMYAQAFKYKLLDSNVKNIKIDML